MPLAKKIQRKKSPKDGEFIFEQWAKYLTIFFLEEDILDSKSSSRIIDNVTAEKLRCVFSQGYRLAMLQVMQSSKRIYNLTDNDDLEHEEIENLRKLIQIQQEFIIEKIEDSFMLNSSDASDGFSLSRELKNNFKKHQFRDYLNW